jgi:hypothetical protein
MEDVSVVALPPHEESNFNVPQHAIEESVQQQKMDDALVGVVEVDVGRAEDECTVV